MHKLLIFPIILFTLPACSKNPEGAFDEFKKISEISTESEISKYELEDCKFKSYSLSMWAYGLNSYASVFDLRGVDIEKSKEQGQGVQDVVIVMERDYKGRLFNSNAQRISSMEQEFTNFHHRIKHVLSGGVDPITDRGAQGFLNDQEKHQFIASVVTRTYKTDHRNIKDSFFRLIEACKK